MSFFAIKSHQMPKGQKSNILVTVLLTDFEAAVKFKIHVDKLQVSQTPVADICSKRKVYANTKTETFIGRLRKCSRKKPFSI